MISMYRGEPGGTVGAVRYRRSPAVLSTRLGDDEIVLMHADLATYFGLTDTAAVLWDLFEDALDVDTAVAHLEARFAVEPERCRAETEAFLAELLAAELLVPVD